MKRIAWLTDLHLDVLNALNRFERIDLVCNEIKDSSVDAVLITGDISTAWELPDHLQYLATRIQKPIYFVLGNHDFYHSTLTEVRAYIYHFTKESNILNWLTRMGAVELTPMTALIGHDGWADGRLGDYQKSDVDLSDYHIIRDFFSLDKQKRLHKLNQLGDIAADYIRSTLPIALEKYQNVIFATHVPPFKEACWHEGQMTNDDYLPHFACKAVGDVLRELMSANPERQLTVLCGHTHGEAQIRILDNLLVLTGGAGYGEPRIERILEIQ